MAEDLLVGSLLIGSAVVNILALGAFWVTPSLRTTANRFVINLLIVNFVSCLILSPSLLLNAFNAETPTFPFDGNDDIASAPIDAIHAATTAQTLLKDVDSETTATTLNRTVECLNRTQECFTIVMSQANSEGSLIDVISELEAVEDDRNAKPHDVNAPTDKLILTLTEIRSWGLDLVVALSVLSVLLVVGDTWCAVTDPLRYHSRISDIKAWFLIAGTWILGAIFGVSSALRSDQKFEQDNFVVATARNLTSNFHNSISEEVYNTVFSYTFFIVIILLPFGLVVCMYWRSKLDKR